MGRPLSLEENKPVPPENGEKVKIYLLPNLFTAGNLACGFFALTWIFKYQPGGDFEPIRMAIKLILAAFACEIEPRRKVCGIGSRLGG